MATMLKCEAVENEIAALFDIPVSVAVGIAGCYMEPLFEVEESTITSASESRRLEFALGRSLARRALARIGAPTGPLLTSSQGPMWPSGFLGSITHTADICAALAIESSAAAGIGLDIEERAALEYDLANIVCNSYERQAFLKLPPQVEVKWEELAFCVKEVAIKATSYLGTMPESLEDISVRFFDFRPKRCGQFFAEYGHGRSAVTVRGRWAINDRLVLCGGLAHSAGEPATFSHREQPRKAAL